VPIRLEQARTLAKLDRWSEAEAMLDSYLRDFPRPIPNYNFHSQAHLMKGFCLHHRGEIAAANVEWKAATWRAYLAVTPANRRQRADEPYGGSRYAAIDNWITCSLSDDLPDEEAKQLVATIGGLAGDDTVGRVVALVNIAPSVLRSAWKSPRGFELARRMAFLDLEPIDFFRTVPMVLVEEKFRQDLFGGRPTAEQDAIVLDAVARVSAEVYSGRLGKEHLLPFGFAWKGNLGTFGWGGVAAKLPPEARGPAAYVLGRKYILLKKPDEARQLFQTASSDAPAGSALRKLAQEEIAGLAKEK
jgi:hypothetical protein